MQSTFTILATGGGSLGHVVPAVAVMDEVRKKNSGTMISFVCADRAEEKEFLTSAGYEFHSIRAPKFPRGLSLKFLPFPFTFLAALIYARSIIAREKPDVIFSKGGFISVPVCLIAWMQKIPVVLHESDSVMSVSSRVIARIAIAVCVGFPDIEVAHILRSKIHHTGNPVRSSITGGSEAAGQRITGFSGRRPVLMIIGGSQGSLSINQSVKKNLTELLDLADVIHLTGHGKETGITHARYFAKPSVIEELPHLYAIADVVVSRGGAGVLSELAALKKPVIVIPLEGVAEDHQVRNAEQLKKKNAAIVLSQQHLDQLPRTLQSLLADVEKQRLLGENLHMLFPPDAAARIADILLASSSSARIES